MGIFRSRSSEIRTALVSVVGPSRRTSVGGFQSGKGRKSLNDTLGLAPFEPEKPWAMNAICTPRMAVEAL